MWLGNLHCRKQPAGMPVADGARRATARCLRSVALGEETKTAARQESPEKTMSYKIIIRYRDENGKENTKSVSLTALNKRDAMRQRDYNHEYAEMQHGKANVIGIELIEEMESNQPPPQIPPSDAPAGVGQN